MRTHRPFRPRCLAAGLIVSWILAIYVSSALLIAAGLAPGYRGRGLLAGLWDFTDQISFGAKLAYALASSALLLGSRAIPMSRPLRTAADVFLACAAMLLVLGLLPRDWSQGLGIGLTGQRFDPHALPRYLAAAALAGLVFTFADANCRNFASRDEDNRE